MLQGRSLTVGVEAQPEGGVAGGVEADLLAVEVGGGLVEDALEVHPDGGALPLGRHVEVLAVPTCEERGDKGLHAFPSNVTRDDPPITRDYTPFLLMLQGMTLRLQGITRLSF